MLLFEAKEEIDSRLSEQMKRDYQSVIPEYFEALEIASKCIDAQMRLADLLNDLQAMSKEDSFSLGCVLEFLEECSFEFKEED